MKELKRNSHKPDICCSNNCGKCCSELKCETGSRGAYMYANTCGCNEKI